MLHYLSTSSKQKICTQYKNMHADEHRVSYGQEYWAV